VLDRIREKLQKLIELAKRPGTPGEGNVARRLAIQLAQKYGIPCEFSPEPPTPKPPEPPSQDDRVYYQWIAAMQGIGWRILSTEDIPTGRLVRFRKLGFASEIRITQIHGRLEATHIMRPDPDADGNDWSYLSFITVSLPDLMRHLNYTVDK
jgi:hypothetical protein